MDLGARVRAAVEPHAAVRAVRLVGSRARGDPTPLSDWDFLVDARDVDAVAEAGVEVPRQPEEAVLPRLEAAGLG